MLGTLSSTMLSGGAIPSSCACRDPPKNKNATPQNRNVALPTIHFLFMLHPSPAKPLLHPKQSSTQTKCDVRIPDERTPLAYRGEVLVSVTEDIRMSKPSGL